MMRLTTHIRRVTHELKPTTVYSNADAERESSSRINGWRSLMSSYQMIDTQRALLDIYSLII
jgi:hypothetical protein